MKINPVQQNEKLAQCQYVFEEYMHYYLTERNLDRICEITASEVTSFGTGRDEKIWGKSDFIKFYKRDIETVPEAISYVIKDHHMYMPTDGVVVSQTILDLHPTIEGYEVTLRDIRQTLVFGFEEDGRPIISHVHTSFPTDLHDDEESYPLKEIQAVSEVVNRLVNEKTDDLKQAYHELEQAVVRDSLTGLFNRNKFDDVFSHETLRSNRYHSPFSLIFCDIDHFKHINDTYGHLRGDEVLKVLANCITNYTRETDLPSRWGGEEFAILLPETGLEESYRIAEVIRKAFANLVIIEGETITISLGVAVFHPGDCPENLFERADRALYRAKQSGRNRTVCEENTVV